MVGFIVTEPWWSWQQPAGFLDCLFYVGRDGCFKMDGTSAIACRKAFRNLSRSLVALPFAKLWCLLLFRISNPVEHLLDLGPIFHRVKRHKPFLLNKWYTRE